MLRYQRRYWLVAAALSSVAGFVDAIAFVHLGGFFVSFMSGNSTRLGVGIASAQSAVALAFGLIALFVSGVVLGAFINRKGNHAGGLRVLSMVSGLLAAAAALAPMNATAIAIAMLAIAMGAMNTVFQRNGEVSIGLTYTTGTLVKLGQRLAAALAGGDRWSWVPYLLLWMGLALGAALGALSYAWMNLASIWFAAAAMTLFTAIFAALPVQNSEP
jgi:uncharacterized membrane protein YoaK (UPF0700 family)